MTKPLVRDGHVAVAVSPGYGGGWSTWSEVDPMDGRFNTLFDQGKYDEAAKLLEKVDDEAISDEIESVVLVWLPVGTRFVIREHDGHEWIETEREILNSIKYIEWYIAEE